MPRANRYIVSGCIYHITHRCHDRKFLFRFAKDRGQYRNRLREAVLESDLSLLTYNITSNHVHLIAFANDAIQIARVMQQAAGAFARDYNRRKDRSGSFWEGRYHVTMVDSGQYLWECMKYVELNMVRCGAVQHPREWPWSGYGELMGQRKRNRLLDVEKLLWLLRSSDLGEFQLHFNRALEESMAKDEMQREPKWTNSLAVGSQTYVENMKGEVRNRQTLESRQDGDAWILRDEYSTLFEPEK